MSKVLLTASIKYADNQNIDHAVVLADLTNFSWLDVIYGGGGYAQLPINCFSKEIDSIETLVKIVGDAISEINTVLQRLNHKAEIAVLASPHPWFANSQSV